MTTEQKTIDELKAEVETLKAAKVEELKAEAEQRTQDLEMARLQAELESLKAGRLPGSVPINGPGVSIPPTERDVKQAAVRQVICGFTHALFGPGASVYYSAKTGYWLPTLAGTGAFVVAVPLALLDFGFTAAVAPPTVSALMVITASNEKRRRLGITMPEQADQMMMKFRTF